MLHSSQLYVGKSDVIVFLLIASLKLLNRPPSFPTGNNTTGVPFIFLSFAFSGRPILVPINVPDLSRCLTGDFELICAKPVAPEVSCIVNIFFIIKFTSLSKVILLFSTRCSQPIISRILFSSDNGRELFSNFKNHSRRARYSTPEISFQ